MGIIVCKFGGTSTAGANMFKQIQKILVSNPSRRYIVLSAPGASGGGGQGAKVTDLLARLWQRSAAHEDYSNILSEIIGRYHQISMGLGIPAIDGLARSEILRAAAISEAHTLSRGEYLCAHLFSKYSGLPMADAADLIRFGPDKKLDLSQTAQKFLEMSRRLSRAVIPGFYGSGPDGGIVTFPRNGSDITGALAAVGVGAALYENWTDVPGLMTADPAVNPHAQLIPEITYDEMRRLSTHGAKVLHPDCLEPVARAGVPTRIKCTLKPDGFGTLIVN